MLFRSKGGLYYNGASGLTEVDKNSVEGKALIENNIKQGQSDTGSLKLSLHVGADATDNNKISIEISSMSAKTLGVEGLKVDTEDSATASINTITAALQKVSDQRSSLGAVQNRLEHTISNLDNVVENTTSAESRIRDVIGPYGESKIAAENYILGRLKAEDGRLKANLYDGKDVYILRPCMIHGPGNKGNLNLLYNVVRKGIPWPLGAFENRRSFTSIDNLC